MVNAALTPSLRAVESIAGIAGGMAEPFLSGRAALDDALRLVEEYGVDAPAVAAARARTSRDRENVRDFCHWRQIERFTALLSTDRVTGSLH